MDARNGDRAHQSGAVSRKAAPRRADAQHKNRLRNYRQKKNARHPHQEDRASTLQGVVRRNECIADPHQESEMHTVDTLGGRTLTSLSRDSHFLQYSFVLSLQFLLTPWGAILPSYNQCYTEKSSSATIVRAGVLHFCPRRRCSPLRRVSRSQTRRPETAPWNATIPFGLGPPMDCCNEQRDH